MKSDVLVERILFVFLILLSSGVAYILMTKSHAFSSDNALLIILFIFWLMLEHKTVGKVFKKTYFYVKKTVHLTGKRKLRKI